jgi:hypothetical protein
MPITGFVGNLPNTSIENNIIGISVKKGASIAKYDLIFRLKTQTGKKIMYSETKP